MKKISLLALSLFVPSLFTGTNVKKREIKKAYQPQPIENDSTRELICKGVDQAMKGGSNQLIDEWLIDKSSPGYMALYPNTSIYIPKGTFTFGMKLTKSGANSILANELDVEVSLRGRLAGPDATDNIKEKMVFMDGTTRTVNSTYIRAISFSRNRFLITFYSPGFYLVEFSANIGNKTKSLTYENVQLSSGSYDTFPSFEEKYHAPCYLPDKTIRQEDIYIDVDISRQSQIVSNLLKSSTAYDEQDKTYIFPVLISDDYTKNQNNFGVYYEVKICATDKSGNTSYLTYHLRTMDKDAPIITPIDQLTIRLPYYELSEEKLLSYFTISDNFRVDSSSIANIDLSIASSNMGEHNFTVKAIDGMGNETSYVSKVDVYDDVGPELKAPVQINSTITKELTDEELLAMASATDYIDGACEVSVDATSYHNNATKVGTYQITYSSKDKSNNITSKTINLIVDDDVGPLFVIYENTLKSYVGEIVDVLKVVNKMSEAGLIKKGNYVDYVLLSGEKLDQPLEAGYYENKVLVTSDEGESLIVNLKIQVEEKPKLVKKLNFWEKILAFFKSLFAKIGSFFVGLFKR